MTDSFAVHSTARYERLSEKLLKTYRDFEAIEKSAAAILGTDRTIERAAITLRN
jgi:hypothetical protein